MTMNLIAMLLSLAMLLTGAGVEGQPAEASRQAVLHNISITCNGETVRPTYQAHMGASTDGQKAVFDFGVDLGDDKLLPIQLGVDEAGVTALFGGSDLAVNVTAKAMEGLAAQMEQLMGAAGGQAQSAELMDFLTNEFMPAYTGVLQAAMDPEMRAEIMTRCKAVYDAQVDRGEGAPAQVEIEEEQYDATAYSYTLDSAHLAALTDEMYHAVPVLENYYNAMFKLYSMLPEEAGFAGIDSYKSLLEKTGVDMWMEIDEKINDEKQLDVMDGVLTINLNGMIKSMAQAVELPEAVEDAETAEAAPETAEAAEAAEAAPETADAPETAGVAPEASEAPVEEIAIPPMVMNLHSVQLADYTEGDVSMAYTMDGEGIEMRMSGDMSDSLSEIDLDMTVLENGEKAGRVKMSMFSAEDGEGGQSYNVSMRGVTQDKARAEVNCYGLCRADGTSENSVSCGLRTPEQNLELSFDLDVTAEAFEDAVTGHKADVVIDDLSTEEAIQAIGEDPAVQGALLQIIGSLSMDAAKLTGDEDTQKVIALLQGETMPIDVDDIDDETYADGDEFTYVIDDDDELVSFDPSPMEDDGVLAFAEPSFGWLPEGWSIASTDVDTAYDWVEMSITDENGEECAYAVFFADPEEPTTNYIVQDDGTVVEGREINVTDFNEGGLSVTLRDSGLYANMMFTSEAIDVETIGRIVAGMAF